APRAGTGALSDAERADPKNEIWRIQDVRFSMLRILSVWLVSLGVMVSASPAFAAFDRLIDPNCSDESDCAYWIPKLPPLKGWHVDEEDSKTMRSRVLAPDGTKGEAAAIYASAVRKIDLPDEWQSIAGLIAKEREDAERNYP